MEKDKESTKIRRKSEEKKSKEIKKRNKETEEKKDTTKGNKIKAVLTCSKGCTRLCLRFGGQNYRKKFCKLICFGKDMYGRRHVEVAQSLGARATKHEVHVRCPADNEEGCKLASEKGLS